MQYTVTEIATGMSVVLSPAPGTPRMALAVAVAGGIRRETTPGAAKLASRLLLKGTERRSAEQLAQELDERAIDLREIVLSDSSLLVAVFLNHELPAVLDILRDVLLHSTFTASRIRQPDMRSTSVSEIVPISRNAAGSSHR